jgi:hypothetical protein
MLLDLTRKRVSVNSFSHRCYLLWRCNTAGMRLYYESMGVMPDTSTEGVLLSKQPISTPTAVQCSLSNKNVWLV